MTAYAKPYTNFFNFLSDIVKEGTGRLITDSARARALNLGALKVASAIGGFKAYVSIPAVEDQQTYTVDDQILSTFDNVYLVSTDDTHIAYPIVEYNQYMRLKNLGTLPTYYATFMPQNGQQLYLSVAPTASTQNINFEAKVLPAAITNSAALFDACVAFMEPICYYAAAHLRRGTRNITEAAAFEQAAEAALYKAMNTEAEQNHVSQVLVLNDPNEASVIGVG